VPVTVRPPVRLWVLPPVELLMPDLALEHAAALLEQGAAEDAAGRRRPAHADPDAAAEEARALHATGIRDAVRLDGLDSRAWRLGAPASAAQQLRAAQHRWLPGV
jgi:hypothetical protein